MPFPSGPGVAPSMPCGGSSGMPGVPWSKVCSRGASLSDGGKVFSGMFCAKTDAGGIVFCVAGAPWAAAKGLGAAPGLALVVFAGKQAGT